MDRPPSAIAAGVTLAPEASAGDGPRWIVAQAEAELTERYGGLDAGERALTVAWFDPPAGAFVVARRGDAAGPPVGGVGVRAVRPGRGEVRRLWVDPDWRGRGVGRRLMAALDDAARDLGLTTLQLATGDRQPEAVALYRATGWERVPFDDGINHHRFTKHLAAEP